MWLLSRSVWGLESGCHTSPAPLRFDPDPALSRPDRRSWSGNGHGNHHPLRLGTLDLKANDPGPSQP